jgi:LPXTG-motif cell wall-anchored protein
MFGRRLLVTGIVGALLFLGTAQVAHAKTVWSAAPDVATTPHDTAVDIDVTANDHLQDGFEILDSPQHGTATIQGLMIHYVPDPGYVGLDAMTYQPVGCSSQGNSTCDDTPARVDITVTGPEPTTTTTAPATTTTLPAPSTTVAVLGSAVTAPAELPRTGSTSGGLAVLAGGLVVAGTGALAVSRRRIRDTHR